MLRVDIPEPLLTAGAMKMRETRRAWTTQAEHEVVGQRGESPLSAYAGSLPLLTFCAGETNLLSTIFSPPKSGRSSNHKKLSLSFSHVNTSRWLAFCQKTRA